MDPIFIVGCGRSGTTLLRQVLGKHKNIYSVPTESHLFVNYKSRAFPFIHYYETNKDVEKLTLSVLTLMFNGDKKSPTLIKEERFTPEIIQILSELKETEGFRSLKNKHDVFNLCANYLTIREKKKRWVEKTPGNIRNLSFILSLYPNAKFVDIYRDPRAVYCSGVNQRILHKSSNLFEGIGLWRAVFKEGQKFLGNMPSQYYQLCYEKLIKNPENELRKLCGFLGEDFDSEMLNVDVVNCFFDDSQGKKGFNILSLTRWKKLLSDHEKLFVDILTKEYRRKLGYADSGVKLTIFNLVPFAVFVIKKCIEGRKTLRLYIKSKVRSLLYNLKTRTTG